LTDPSNSAASAAISSRRFCDRCSSASRRALHFLNLENVAPENLDGLDHPSDFIGAIGVIQADGGVAGRQPLHAIGDRCDRLDDRSGNESHGGDADQKACDQPDAEREHLATGGKQQGFDDRIRFRHKRI
jgi:hypothetical protein